MKYTFTIFKEKKKGRNTFPVVFRVFDNGYSYEWLDFEVEECHWDKSEGWLYRPSKDKDKLKIEKEKGLVQHPNFSKFNEKLKNYQNRVDKIIDRYEAEGRKHELTGDRLMKELSGGSNEDFIEFAKAFIRREYNDSLTIKAKISNINKIARYNKFKPLLITHITYPWAVELKNWLFSKGKENGKPYSSGSVKSVFKDLKLVMDEAAREGKIKQGANPITLIKIVVEDADREALSIEEVRLLENCKTEYWSWEFHAKNLWLFSFYCHGMRFSDLMLLRKGNLEVRNTSEGDQWILRYIPKKGKTKKVQSDKVNNKKKKKTKEVILDQKAIKIWKTYAEVDTGEEFLFPFLKADDFKFEKVDQIKHKNELDRVISSLNATAGPYIKKVAAQAGIKKKMMFHTTRNTIGQLLIDNGYDPADAQAVFLHDSRNATGHYIDESKSIANKMNKIANQAVLSVLDY